MYSSCESIAVDIETASVIFSQIPVQERSDKSKSHSFNSRAGRLHVKELDGTEHLKSLLIRVFLL